MTYAPAFLTALDAMVPGLAPRRSRSLPSRLLAALGAEVARRQAIHDYRKLMEVEPHLLADIGLTRNEVRQALKAAERG
jgi:uncharacterized protein YjiS (DUF1127 family)